MKFIDRIKSDKKLKILSISLIVLISLLVFRVAFAYMAMEFNIGKGNVTISSNSVDEFKIIPGEPLNLNVTSSTLKENGTNHEVISSNIVKLRRNDIEGNTATINRNYYVYLGIAENTIKYTTPDNKPEVVLSVTGPEGEIKNIEGLSYNETLKGFDITEYSGLIKIKEGQNITSNSGTIYTEHNWNISLKYINLDTNQSSNVGKSMRANIIIRKTPYKIPVLTLNSSNITETSFKLNVTSTTGTSSIKKYYFSKDNGVTWNESTTSSYTYSGLTAGTTYNVIVKAVDNNNVETAVVNRTITTSYRNGTITAVINDNDVKATSIKVNITGSSNGTNPITKYAYKLDEGNWVIKNATQSDAKYHTFTGLTKGQLYKISVKGIDTKNKDTNIVTFNKKYVLPLASKVVITAFNNQGGGNTPTANMTTSGAIYHHKNLTNSAEDDSYRYAGKNPNNYICIGKPNLEKQEEVDEYNACLSKDTNLETKKNNNYLYRIIGVFGEQLKVIKNTSIGNLSWNTVEKNIWQESSLQKGLNGDSKGDSTAKTYYDKYIYPNDANIAMHDYVVEGNDYIKISNDTPDNAYQNEIKKTVAGSYYENNAKTWQGKIGLMYAHDYGYGASSNNWTTILYNYDGTAKNENWLYLGAYEWLITRHSSASNYAFNVHSDGYVDSYDNNHVTLGNGVRPVYYLVSDTKISNGDGSLKSPYQI